MYGHDGTYLTVLLLVYIGVLVIIGCFFGLITRKINKNKGYEGGFAWGFFLWVIGIIVVACKTDKRVLDALEKQKQDQDQQ